MEFLILTLAAAFFFALTFYFRKQGGKFLPPQAALTVEAIVELILLLLFLFAFNKNPMKTFQEGSRGLIFALFAGLSVAAGVVLNFLSLRTGFLSKVTAITSPSQIIFGVLLGIFLAGESFTLRQVIGTLIAIGGMVLVILK